MPKLSDLLSGAAGEKPTEEALRKKAFDRIAPDYAMLFFDHLYSEYLALKPPSGNSKLGNCLKGFTRSD